MNILSHFSGYIDPCALSKYDDLCEATRNLLSDHPKIVRLQKIRENLAVEAKELYGSMKNAASTKIGELKAKAEATLRAAIKQLKKRAFDGARNKLFATIDTVETNKQHDPSLIGVD